MSNINIKTKLLSLILAYGIYSVIFPISQSQAENITCGNKTCINEQTCKITPITSPSPTNNFVDPSKPSTNQTPVNRALDYQCVDPPIVSPRPSTGVPVNIISPLPIPTNIVSPSPLPVIVVDDLALYQQKELIDAPLAAKQKALTLGKVADATNSQIVKERLVSNIWNDLFKETIGSALTSPVTGVLDQLKVAYGSIPGVDILAITNAIAKKYDNSIDLTSNSLPKSTYQEECGDEIQDTSLKCFGLAFHLENNPAGVQYIAENIALQRVDQAKEIQKLSLQIGQGYSAKTKNNIKNPFIQEIESPGKTVGDLVSKTNLASLDQAIQSDKCYSSVPSSVIEGTYKPILEKGLFKPVSTDSNNVLESVGGILLNKLTESINCQLNSSLYDLILKNITPTFPPN